MTETMEAYTFTPEMGEISGFGGSYEAGCRAMVRAGLLFWDAQPASYDPHFRGFKGVYGLLDDDNADAKALSQAIIDAPFTDPETGTHTTVGKYGATGAMHHAAIAHILFVRRAGWGAYVRKMSGPDEPAEVTP